MQVMHVMKKKEVKKTKTPGIQRILSSFKKGLASLIAKGIVYKKSRNQYSIHSQLSPYIQRNKFGLWICNKTRDLLIPRKIKNIQYSKPMLANLTELF
jgi:hypothetical protein